MKGTLYCTKCGTANATDSNFCYKCGQSISKEHVREGSGDELILPKEQATAVEQQDSDDHPAPTKVAQPKLSNFIAKHWRGEYSLGVSYWLFGLVVTLLLTAMSSLDRKSTRLNSSHT